MELTTKFQVGQRVYKLSSEKIKVFTVCRIDIDVCIMEGRKETIEARYLLRDASGAYTNTLREDQFFESLSVCLSAILPNS